MTSHINKEALFASLPPQWAEDLLPSIRTSVAASSRKLVVLDDDPTGTQTVYDVAVLTTWTEPELCAELAASAPCFYILTNTRSLTADAASSLNREIAINLKQAAIKTGSEFSIVSRSDSTLRGHFPAETLALSEQLGGFHGVLVIPYFEAGGRYTVGDVHYVADGEMLVPAAETQFAKDASFGYRSSNLREWVAEKTLHLVSPESVASVSIEDIRLGGPKSVCERLLQIDNGSFCVVNAASPSDLEVFVQGLLLAEAQGRKFLFRTAASFVAARLGLEPRPLWQPEFSQPAPNGSGRVPESLPGGLTIVGSYVPKTTGQLTALEKSGQAEVWKLNVRSLLSETTREQVLADAIAKTEFSLKSGNDVFLATSRELVTASDVAGNLEIGNCISAALVELVQRLNVRPRYLIAKGGVTSSDLATKGLGVRRATVLGQILPGVPIWKLGDETKFPGLPYIVFPGNVGEDDALSACLKKLKKAEF